MSYRYEKIESGIHDLVISGWEDGIADSPLEGHGNMVNVDIFKNTGMIQAQHASVKVSGTNVTGLPNWIVQDPVSGEIFALDSNGVVYRQSTGWAVLGGNTLTGANGNGLAVYISQNDPTKSFLFVARNSFVDVYAIQGATWTNGWQALESNFNHPMKLSSNQRLYIGNEWKVASFEEVFGSTFVPGTPATYTWNNNALDLPGYYDITCLEQLGDFLSIGTEVGSNGNQTIADLFFWDRESDSFARPVSFATDGIHQLLTSNNSLIVYAGSAADIFLTNSSSAQLLVRFQNIDFNDTGKNTHARAGAIESLANSEILIGVSNSTSGLNPMGVYGVRDGKYILRNKVSTGATGALGTVAIGSIFSYYRDRFYFGWRDANANQYGIDAVNDNGDRYSDWSASVETDLIPINTNYFPTNLNEVEIRIADLLSSNQGVRVSWRSSLLSAFSAPVTFDDTNMLGANTFALPINIENVKNLQLKIEIKARQELSPRLWEVRLR